MAETPTSQVGERRSVRRGLLWSALLALTIALTIVLQAVNAPLKTPAAPQGIVSYEFAGTAAAAQSILDSWDAGAKVNAGFSLGAGLPLHARLCADHRIGMRLGCKRVGTAEALARQSDVLTFGLGLAALLDAFENYVLTTMLFSVAANPWPAVARWCATGKFALIIAGLLYTLTGFIFWLTTRRSHKGTWI